MVREEKRRGFNPRIYCSSGAKRYLIRGQKFLKIIKDTGFMEILPVLGEEFPALAPVSEYILCLPSDLQLIETLTLFVGGLYK